VFCATGIALSILRVFVDKRTIESGTGGGLTGLIFGFTFLFCFLYILNYMVVHLAKSRIIKRAWWIMVALIALVVLLSVRIPIF